MSRGAAVVPKIRSNSVWLCTRAHCGVWFCSATVDPETPATKYSSADTKFPVRRIATGFT